MFVARHGGAVEEERKTPRCEKRHPPFHLHKNNPPPPPTPPLIAMLLMPRTAFVRLEQDKWGIKAAKTDATRERHRILKTSPSPPTSPQGRLNI